MASTITNSVSRYIPRVWGENKRQNKKNKNVNSVEVANIVVSNLFTTIGNKPATYTLEGDTFLTLELQNPLDNKNNVIKIVNNSGYEHEITGTLPNVFNSLNVSYSKIEFSNQKGSFVTLMSDGSIYNVLDTSGLIKYE
jgi:hypothetical protein